MPSSDAKKIVSIPIQLSILFVFCSLIGLLLSGINYNNPYGDLGINLGISYLIGFSIWSIDNLQEHIDWIRITALRAVISILAGSLVGGSIGFTLFMQGHEMHNSNELFRILLLGVFFGAVALYIVISQITIYRRREQLALERSQRAEQQQQLTQSRLDSLQAQIEPHFLFNTLANIDSRIDSSPETAKQMLGHLTHLLRNRLKMAEALTTVESELSLIEDYLAIQKLRLGERLNYTLDVDDHVADFVIPPLLIQPLVENAVTHGIESNVAGGDITIRVEIDGEQLFIRVMDDGVGVGNSQRAGSGLALGNIRERLQTLYGESGTFNLMEDDTGHTVAQLTIPLSSLNRFQPIDERAD